MTKTKQKQEGVLPREDLKRLLNDVFLVLTGIDTSKGRKLVDFLAQLKSILECPVCQAIVEDVAKRLENVLNEKRYYPKDYALALVERLQVALM